VKEARNFTTPADAGANRAAASAAVATAPLALKSPPTLEGMQTAASAEACSPMRCAKL